MVHSKGKNGGSSTPKGKTTTATHILGRNQAVDTMKAAEKACHEATDKKVEHKKDKEK